MKNGNDIRIKFLGGAGTVTGSKHLLITPERKVLIDCGLFQGLKNLRELNWKQLPLDPRTIDDVVITHAHLDHIGCLPVLVRAGFRGRILMTAPTRSLAEIILRDSAKLQEQDAERANREGYSKHHPARPLYDEDDVERTFSRMENVAHDHWEQIAPSISFRYRRNGHILGSCFADFDVHGRRIVFSGDIGRDFSFTLERPFRPEKADFVIMESTYGDRLHPQKPVEEELAGIINEDIKDGGNILIPSFAVGRAQELMIVLNRLKQEGKIPRIPVYLDTPMGEEATQILWMYRDWHKLDDAGMNGLYDDVIHVGSQEATLAAVRDRQPKIVIAASGMLTGGRVLSYLQSYIGDSRNTILLVGYQAAGTRGRLLQDGAQELKFYGKYYPVLSKVRSMQSLSAHADQKELLEWIGGISPAPENIFLVHGEAQASHTLKVRIRDKFGWKVTVPEMNEEIFLSGVYTGSGQ